MAVDVGSGAFAKLCPAGHADVSSGQEDGEDETVVETVTEKRTHKEEVTAGGGGAREGDGHGPVGTADAPT